jgi:hypothetical protein
LLEIQALASTLNPDEIREALHQTNAILGVLQERLRAQDALDLESLQRLTGTKLNAAKAQELLQSLNDEFLWTFILAGIEHPTFEKTWQKIAPEGALTLDNLTRALLQRPPNR